MRGLCLLIRNSKSYSPLPSVQRQATASTHFLHNLHFIFFRLMTQLKQELVVFTFAFKGCFV